MTVSIAIRDRLTNDQTLTALLATYKGGPAIIVGDEGTIPEDVPTPFVVIPGADQDEPFDCKEESGREVVRPVRCYTDATGSTALVEQIAERIRALLHRQPHGLAPGAHIATCSGPIVAPTDTAFYGRQVTVRITSLVTFTTTS